MSPNLNGIEVRRIFDSVDSWKQDPAELELLITSASKSLEFSAEENMTRTITFQLARANYHVKYYPDTPWTNYEVGYFFGSFEVSGSAVKVPFK